jgi:hypothetical protein
MKRLTRIELRRLLESMLVLGQDDLDSVSDLIDKEGGAMGQDMAADAVNKTKDDPDEDDRSTEEVIKALLRQKPNKYKVHKNKDLIDLEGLED